MEEKDNLITKEEKDNIYTNHNGEKIDISTLHSTHLLNALSKKMREVFEVKTKEEAYEMMKEVRALKEEAYKRINIFIEELGDNEDGE